MPLSFDASWTLLAECQSSAILSEEPERPRGFRLQQSSRAWALNNHIYAKRGLRGPASLIDFVRHRLAFRSGSLSPDEEAVAKSYGASVGVGPKEGKSRAAQLPCEFSITRHACRPASYSALESTRSPLEL